MKRNHFAILQGQTNNIIFYQFTERTYSSGIQGEPTLIEFSETSTSTDKSLQEGRLTNTFCLDEEETCVNLQKGERTRVTKFLDKETRSSLLLQ